MAVSSWNRRVPMALSPPARSRAARPLTLNWSASSVRQNSTQSKSASVISRLPTLRTVYRRLAAPWPLKTVGTWLRFTAHARRRAEIISVAVTSNLTRCSRTFSARSLMLWVSLRRQEPLMPCETASTRNTALTLTEQSARRPAAAHSKNRPPLMSILMNSFPTRQRRPIPLRMHRPRTSPIRNY